MTDILEKATEAFQAAAFKPTSWVDAKRGVEAVINYIASLP
jgi:hypothetical protein